MDILDVMLAVDWMNHANMDLTEVSFVNPTDFFFADVASRRKTSAVAEAIGALLVAATAVSHARTAVSGP